MATLWYDNYNLVTKLNLTKIFNALKVYGSFYWSKLTKKGCVIGLPLSITIEPTTACNLGCPECPSGLKQFTRAEGNLKPDFYKKIINEVQTHVFCYCSGTSCNHTAS